MASCSVVIVSYYTGPVLLACVKGTLKQSLLAELIIVDNGNPPDVLARLRQMALTEPRLSIITGHGNVGLAKAYNLGAAKATGDYLVLLNPECLLPPEALADMMLALQEAPGAMLVGPALINPDGSEWHTRVGGLPTPGSYIARTLGLHLFERFKRHQEWPQPENAQEVDAISTVCACIKRIDYNQLLGFDEAFFLHVADIDFCQRVRKTGGKILRLPKLLVTHMPGSGRPLPRVVLMQEMRGTMRYFRKHFHGQYPPGFLYLGDVAALARYTFRMLSGEVRRRLRDNMAMANSVSAKRLMILASGLVELPEGKDLVGKAVLVTGATSQIGLCVVRRLLATGASVLAISRSDAIPFRHDRLRWIKGDLTDQGLHLHGYLLDIAVHCAPLQHLPGTVNMLADAEIKRVIAFSSTSIFVKALSKNDFEKNMAIVLSRAEGDVAQHCQERRIRYTIFRPTVMYGVGLDVGITTLAKFIRRTGFFPVYPPAFGRRQPVHTDDLALAVLQSIGAPNSFGKSYNLSGGEVLTFRQMLEKLFAVGGRKVRILQTTLLPFALDVLGFLLHKKHINGEVARRMNDDLVFFHDEAKRDFGFNPRNFLSNGLKDIEGF